MTAGAPLWGRTAVITGAARGIGQEVARALSARGARTALLGHEGARLEQVAAALPGAAAWEVDVTDLGQMARVAADVERRLGPASVVVANAGIAAGGPFLREAPQTWSRVVEVNLIGSSVTARVFLPALLDTHGYYLQIASLAALAPSPMLTAYCASKAGAEAFARSLRTEVAHTGVDVGVAYFSWTDTDMIRAADQHSALRLLRSAMPWPASKTYPASELAAVIVRGIERRSPTIYGQRWLRAVNLARAFIPALVTLQSRRVLGRLEGSARLEPTGPLGRGGETDRAGG